MADRKLSLAVALAAVAFLGLLSQAAGKPPAHLDPFPEDQAEAQAAAPRPAKPQPPISNFQPRFRAPAVKQVEHLEPIAGKPGDEAEPADAAKAEASDAAQLLPADPASDTSHLKGRAALDEAYARSKTASSSADYSEVIELCQRAKSGGIGKMYEDYAHRLMGWAYNRRGEARAKDGKDTEALADFEAAVSAGGSWRAIHNRGVSYAAQGRVKEAMADFDSAIELNPRYPNAYFNRGELLSKEGDDQAAITDYTQALKLGPPQAAIYSGRGHAFYRMQRFGDALRDYGEAIKLDPENAAVLVNRGDTYSDVGQYGEAAKDYRAAVRVAPKNGRAFQAAAWLMATCPDSHYRDEKLAIDAAQRAIELDGASYRNLSTLAAAQANAGMFAEAQKSQEQAISAAEKSDRLTAEKMMGLYRREVAYRDRPFTAFRTPEEMDEKEVKQATAIEPADPAAAQAPQGRRAWFQAPEPQQQPGKQSPPRGSKAQPAAPRGRI